MKNYTIRFNADDQRLIDIISLYPEPIKVFAFIPSANGMMEVSTDTKSRFDKWVNALSSANCEFEII